MNFELFIARRIKLGNNNGKSTPSLNIALTGIVLAIVVMILSLAIVLGFKKEITNKIYSLDPHIKVVNAVLGLDDKYHTINGREAFAGIASDSTFSSMVSSMSLIADKPAILKTDNDFKGIQYRGVDKGFDWTYLQSHLTEGRIPTISDTENLTEIIISQTTANQLNLKAGDKILTYFIDNKVKVRNSHIVGIYSTDFDSFDDNFIIGNIALIQQVNGWTSDIGNYIGINMKDISNLQGNAYQLFGSLAADCYNKENTTLFNVTNTHKNNVAFFAWLDMLDMNVIIIIVLMLIVSGFTLVSALLMIVLDRIRMIGMLKALGCRNSSIRRIFIYLTQKLIFKSLIIGNIIGLALALIQDQFHIIKLDAASYYMPYVPISLDFTLLVGLNIGIIVISYLTLLGPSYVISTVKPASTMRFE